MDLGKNMTGIMLVLHPVGVPVTPSGAAGPGHSCTVGCRSALFPAGATVTPYSPLVRETPAGYLAPVARNTRYGSAP